MNTKVIIILSCLIFVTGTGCNKRNEQTWQQNSKIETFETITTTKDNLKTDITERTVILGNYTIIPANGSFFLTAWNDSEDVHYKKRCLTSVEELTKGSKVFIINDSTNQAVQVKVGEAGTFGHIIESWQGNILLNVPAKFNIDVYGIGINDTILVDFTMYNFERVLDNICISALDSLVKTKWIDLKDDIFGSEAEQDTFLKLPEVYRIKTIEGLFFLVYRGSALSPVLVSSGNKVAVLGNQASSLYKVITFNKCNYVSIEIGTPDTDECGYIYYQISKDTL
jgi:hypothetical protein